jgi:hypothetical protein
VENPLLPAAVLVAAGVQLVVVGSAALVEHGDLDHANDLDVVPRCTSLNLARLSEELRHLAYRAPTIHALAEAEVLTVHTSFGPVDLLLDRGRRQFDALAARASTIDVEGVDVAVACRADAWRLRHRFKAAQRG